MSSIFSNHVCIEKGGNCQIQIGKKSRILGRGKIRASDGSVEIGNGCEIRDSSLQANKGKIKIGDGTFFNSGCIVTSCESVTIGKDCAFGTNVSIYDQDHVFSGSGKQDWNLTKTTPISIGDNCWIGCNVVILRGSRIGDNCVIGAGTVIKGIVPDSSLVHNDHSLIIKELKNKANTF